MKSTVINGRYFIVQRSGGWIQYPHYIPKTFWRYIARIYYKSTVCGPIFHQVRYLLCIMLNTMELIRTNMSVDWIRTNMSDAHEYRIECAGRHEIVYVNQGSHNADKIDTKLNNLGGIYESEI